MPDDSRGTAHTITRSVRAVVANTRAPGIFPEGTCMFCYVAGETHPSGWPTWWREGDRRSLVMLSSSPRSLRIWGNRGTVPVMPERQLPGPFESAGHRAEIGYTGGGMGNPGSYTCECSCGWRSTWEELRVPIDTPIEKSGFVQYFIDEVQAAGGMRSWNAVYPARKMGRVEQALGETLEHLRVTTDQARGAAASRVHDSMEQLRALLNTGAGDDLQGKVNQIVGAAAALDNAQAAAAYLDSVEPDARAGMP